MSDLDEALKRQAELAVKLSGVLVRLELARDAEVLVDKVRSALGEVAEQSAPILEVLLRTVVKSLVDSALEKAKK